MVDKIKVAVDCMGGDNSPRIVIEGLELAAKKNKDATFLLYGKSEEINEVITVCPALKGRYTLIHTDEVVSSNEKPSIALRRATNSSMRLAINAVKDNEADVAVSAGNTGALMAIAKIVLRSLPSIERPAIVTSIPNQKNSGTVLLDMGANVECDSDVLFQFAVMGHAFAKIALKISNPKIGILNIGSEDLKGNDAVRSAALMLKESDLSDNFYGYVEGNDITKGTVDVVVTDGFTGNISLKVIEGTAKMVTSILRQAFSSGLFSRIGYLLARPALIKARKKMDPRMHNGAMLVGLNGVVVKSHGGADSVGFANAVSVAISLVKNDINQKISEELKMAE